MVAEVLKQFYGENRIAGSKGALCVGLVVTREAREKGIPLKFDSLLTENRGQVRILGKAPVQKVLNEYGITRVLAEEGGRTNRGNMGLAEKYVELLNANRFTVEQLARAELWWIDRVRDYFAGKPLVMKFDPSNQSDQSYMI